MERLTKFGYVWKHKNTGEVHGASIDVKTLEELKEYEQIPRSEADETKKQNDLKTNKSIDLPKEKIKDPEDAFFANKSRRTE